MNGATLVLLAGLPAGYDLRDGWRMAMAKGGAQVIARNRDERVALADLLDRLAGPRPSKWLVARWLRALSNGQARWGVSVTEYPDGSIFVEGLGHSLDHIPAWAVGPGGATSWAGEQYASPSMLPAP